MELWIGGEVGLPDDDFSSYRIAVNKIEKQINQYLKEIGYSNDEIEELRLIPVIIEHKGFYEKNKSSLDRVGRVYLEIRKLRNQLAHINESKDFEDIKKMVFGYIFKVESIYKDDVLSSLRG